MGWNYLNYYEPLFLPLGLGVLIVYTNIDIYSSKKSSSARTSELGTVRGTSTGVRGLSVDGLSSKDKDDSQNTTAINIK